jgi:hypothetical protein
MAQEASAPQRGRAKGEEAENRSSLFEHWIETGTYPIREFLDLPPGRQLGYLHKPLAFAWWGVGKQIDVIGMHYEYFIG